MLTLPLILVIGHFVADFLFQNDWMALNKSKSLAALHAHVSVYTAVMLPFVYATGLTRESVLLFLVVTFLTHFATDFCTSRLTGKLWFIEALNLKDMLHVKEFQSVGIDADAYPLQARVIPGRRHWFFVVIGADQLIHYTTLAATWWYFVR
jgi:hypothetical protein